MDLLVRLYDLPELHTIRQPAEAAGFEVRRALVPERGMVTSWVRDHFSEGWASECEITFSRQPVACFIAVRRGALCGFACHDATCRNFFGPLGVAENVRALGVGRLLTLECLAAMREQGYAYAIVGWAGPVEFFRKVAGAVSIEESSPGIYRGLLERKPKGPAPL